MTVREGDSELFSTLCDLLRTGGVAIVPCDTMYGFIGSVPASESRIRDIKGRGEEKPFLQLIAEASWVGRMSDFRIPPTLAAYWPGPLTIIVPLRTGGTAGVRVPASVFLMDLIRDLGLPVYSTSVNRTGAPPLWRIEEIREEFEADVDLVVDAGDLPNSIPSTIVDATIRPCRIVRHGALAIAAGDLL
jgi:L-threonylcarbamoyladenylate synthase